MLFTPAADRQPADGLRLTLLREIALTEKLEQQKLLDRAGNKSPSRGGGGMGGSGQEKRTSKIVPLLCKEGSDGPSWAQEQMQPVVFGFFSKERLNPTGIGISLSLLGLLVKIMPIYFKK